MMYHGNLRNIIILTLLFIFSIISIFNKNAMSCELLTYRIFAGLGLFLLLLSLIFIISPQKESYFMICLFLSGIFLLISSIIWYLDKKINTELYMSFLISILCIIFSFCFGISLLLLFGDWDKLSS